MSQESAYTGTPDTTSGTKIATEKCVEDNTVEIQQVVTKGSPSPTTVVSSPFRSGVTSTDSTDLSSFTTDSAHRLEVYNNTTLCVSITDEDSNSSVGITPVYLDSSGNVIGIGETKTFSVSSLEDGGATAKYYAPMEMWDTFGAYEVMLHVTSITGSGNSIDIYAYVI